ncbi:hypothetical protein J7M28_06300 [bacterium]|nr:hypothetical protein [bacterium]
MLHYPPYEIVKAEERIQQGDILTSCPLFEIIDKVEAGQEYETDVLYYDVIILTQSCDLAREKPKVKSVVFCPIWELEKFEKNDPLFKERNRKERNSLKNDLRQGSVVGFHLLMKPELGDIFDDFLAVDFRRTSSLPYRFLARFSKNMGPRLRLLPPYREHLSQAFARFFMRVGLPVDIPPFK